MANLWEPEVDRKHVAYGTCMRLMVGKHGEARSGGRDVGGDGEVQAVYVQGGGDDEKMVYRWCMERRKERQVVREKIEEDGDGKCGAARRKKAEGGEAAEDSGRRKCSDGKEGGGGRKRRGGC